MVYVKMFGVFRSGFLGLPQFLCGICFLERSQYPGALLIIEQLELLERCVCVLGVQEAELDQDFDD
jgi:hypothetical protein